jgi:hypothetical protein
MRCFHKKKLAHIATAVVYECKIFMKLITVLPLTVCHCY